MHSYMDRNRPRPIYYLLPSLVLIGFFYIYAILRLFPLSLYDAHTVKGLGDFIGLGNYRELLDPKYLVILFRTFVWVAGSTLLVLPIAVAVALIMNMQIPARRVLRVLILVSWSFPMAISAIMWKWLLHLEYGLVNQMLILSGLIKEPISFLGVRYAFAVGVAARTWQSLPFGIMSVLAALQSIDESMYEAALVDGANRTQTFLRITLPLLGPTIKTTAIILAIWSITTFDLLWVLTEGGPLGRSEILPITIYKQAFQSYDAGLAAAMSVVSLLFILVLAAMNFRNQSRNG